MELKPRTKIARRLRWDATEAERQLWRALRDRLPEYRFRRQHPIAEFIVDFACPARKVVIEIDGGQHALREEQDAARTAELARRGYRLIRFWNNDVMQNLAGVLGAIRQELDS
jgi:very-short-patch-repair endonuclease